MALLAGLVLGPALPERTGELGSLAPADLLARLAHSPAAYVVLGVAVAMAVHGRARRGRSLAGADRAAPGTR